MVRFAKIVSNTVFVLLCILTILLFFEEYVRVPYWLQPIGRMHPLVLHFPVVLIFLLILTTFFKGYLGLDAYQKIHQFLLLFTALTTTLAAVMGFFLYQEGYDSELMTWHKWLGVGLAYMTYLFIFIHSTKGIYLTALYSCGVLTIFVGHFGAEITHGANFLTAPLGASRIPEITEESPIFETFVQPILNKKCVSCHNSEKHKGGLNMSTHSAMMTGGENGPLWIMGNSEESQLMLRALLPMADEAHMPPQGKLQLTTKELQLLERWIDSGADTLSSLANLPTTDSLHTLVQEEWYEKVGSKARHVFAPADKELIVSLNNPYRTVKQQSPKSPALEVAIFGQSAFQPALISELLGIKEQVVSLNLSGLPITDTMLQPISEMVNLETLNLNFTDVTHQGLAKLAACTKLRSLAISGTSVTADIHEVLNTFSDLQTLFLWNTSITADEVLELQSAFPKVQFDTGDNDVTEEKFQLAAPLLKNESAVLGKGDIIVLDHKLKGVKLRYTLDGSQPDSTSQLYNAPLQFDKTFVLKTKAFKTGWESSELGIFNFFQKGKKPEDFELLSKPDFRYKGLGPHVLLDDYISGQDKMISLAWMGFIEEPLIFMSDFGTNPPTLSKMMLSYGIVNWRKIMPPESVEVWGGYAKDQMKLIKRKAFGFTKDGIIDGASNVSVKFPQSNFRYYKIVANQFQKIPSWHQHKGKKSELFVDEVFFYE